MFKTPTFGEKRPASVLAAVAGPQAAWIETLWPDPAALFRVDDARRQLVSDRWSRQSATPGLPHLTGAPSRA